MIGIGTGVEIRIRIRGDRDSHFLGSSARVRAKDTERAGKGKEGEDQSTADLFRELLKKSSVRDMRGSFFFIG